jgi:hypothetical protein
MPNSYTLPGQHVLNSITTNWEDFVARDLVEAVDAHYRDLRSVPAWLVGHPGGYGATRIGMKHRGVRQRTP